MAGVPSLAMSKQSQELMLSHWGWQEIWLGNQQVAQLCVDNYVPDTISRAEKSLTKAVSSQAGN